MFKSTFAKFLTAFILCLTISFIILSSIVTNTVRAHVAQEKEFVLMRTGDAISKQIVDHRVENLENYVYNQFADSSIKPLLKIEKDINIAIVTAEGKMLLYGGSGEDGEIDIQLIRDGRTVDIKRFDRVVNNETGVYLTYSGVVKNISGEKVQICAKEIKTNNVLRGYVLASVSTDDEDALVAKAKNSIITNTLWVMLAAVIAVYFVTERLIHPLKDINVAVKRFAKGDFSTRVTVYGGDEVAELAESFNNMAEYLDNFEKMRNSFLANVSHDLRTPMTTISGFIDGITSGAIPPEKHNYYLGIISDEVHRLSRLVTDLLDISKLESGERKFEFVKFDIAEMSRIILISFEQQIEDKKLDVIFEAEEDSMLVVADKDAIHQVLYNLCHNAIKFAKEGGKFAISISRTEQKKIRVSVYDEGLGINKEDLALVFDRFYKTDTSRGLDKNGVGLGLYICKTIIDAHKEKIHAESPSDNGAEFWFTLPEADAKKKN